MAIDGVPPRSRRALLAGGLGAAAAMALGALGRPDPTYAANGDNVVLGQSNSADSTTTLQGANFADPTFDVIGADGASGIHGKGGHYGVRGDTGYIDFGGVTPPTGVGVLGLSFFEAGVIGQHMATKTGVLGFSGGTGLSTPSALESTGVLGVALNPGRGVHGFSGPNGSVAHAPVDPIGVYGEASGADPTGVWGEGGTATSGSTTGVYGEGDTGVWGFGGWGVFGASDNTGTGVYGLSAASVPAAPAHTGVFGFSDSGTGIYARSATGTALYVNGKANFSRSGRVSITSGHTSVSKTLSGVTTSSLIIAVLQTYRSGYVLAAAVPASGKFTVYLNKAAASTIYIAYFVVN